MSDSIPPQERTSVGKQLSQLAPAKGLQLQVCQDCDTVQYPPRELCKQCLSPRLVWSEVESGGAVLACTTLFNSLESYFNERSPWTVGTVKLDCGPVLVTHIAMSCYGRDMRVQVMLAHDDGGSTVLVAVPAESAADGIGEDKSVAELMALE